MTHRYNYPITIDLEGGAKTTGTYILTSDEELTPEELQRRREAYETTLNEQAANPLLPGAKYTLGPPHYKRLGK